MTAENSASGLSAQHRSIDWKVKKSTGSPGVLIRNRWISLWKDKGTTARFRKSKNYAYCGVIQAQPFFVSTAEPYVEQAIEKAQELLKKQIEGK